MNIISDLAIRIADAVSKNRFHCVAARTLQYAICAIHINCTTSCHASLQQISCCTSSSIVSRLEKLAGKVIPVAELPNELNYRRAQFEAGRA